MEKLTVVVAHIVVEIPGYSTNKRGDPIQFFVAKIISLSRREE